MAWSSAWKQIMRTDGGWICMTAHVVSSKSTLRATRAGSTWKVRCIEIGATRTTGKSENILRQRQHVGPTVQPRSYPGTDKETNDQAIQKKGKLRLRIIPRPRNFHAQAYPGMSLRRMRPNTLCNKSHIGQIIDSHYSS